MEGEVQVSESPLPSCSCSDCMVAGQQGVMCRTMVTSAIVTGCNEVHGLRVVLSDEV